MSEETIRARFQVHADGRWIPVSLIVENVNFHPSKPRIADLTVMFAGGGKKLTYLDEVTRTQIDGVRPGGKLLGPILRRNITMSDTSPIVSVLDEKNNGIVDSLYPMSDDYQVYGVWGFLDLISAGLA